MARLPKPWYRKDRDSWFVTINGTRHNLGPDKKAAFEQFYDLMSRPKEVAVKPDAFVVVADRSAIIARLTLTNGTAIGLRGFAGNGQILWLRRLGHTTYSNGSTVIQIYLKPHNATTFDPLSDASNGQHSRVISTTIQL